MIHTEGHNKTWKEHNKTWKDGEEKSISPKFYKQQMHLLKINHFPTPHTTPPPKKNTHTRKMKELVWQLTPVVILDLGILV